MAKKRKTSRFDTEAAAQALVRYGPQMQVLEEARRTANSNYRSAIEQAKAGEIGVRQAIDDVTPQVRDIYETAGLGALGAQSLMSKDLAGLGSVADSIKAGASLEAGATANRLRAAQAQALTGLADRRVQAASGAAVARRQAQAKLVDDLAKILGQAQSLEGQKGAFITATAGDLRNAYLERAKDKSIASAGNAQSERNSLRSAGIDPDTGKPIPGGKLDPKAKKGPKVTPTGQKVVSGGAHGKFQDQLGQVSRIVQDEVSSGASRAQIASDLVKGVPSVTIKKGTVDPGTGEKAKTDIKVPAIPQTDELLASVALDLMFDGHVSQRNVKKLWERGFSVRQLGLPTRRNSRGSFAARLTRGALGQVQRVIGG